MTQPAENARELEQIWSEWRGSGPIWTRFGISDPRSAEIALAFARHCTDPLTARIRELEAENKRLGFSLRTAESQLATLREALEPFVIPDAWLNNGECIWCGSQDIDDNCRIVHSKVCRIEIARAALAAGER